MRTLSQTFRTEASGDQNQPIEIYDVYLDSQVLHFAQYIQNINFYDLDGNAETYLAMPIERDGARASSDASINNITIRMANIDKAMSAYLASNEFRGRRLVIRKLFNGISTTSGDCARIFDGLMDRPSADENWLSVTAVDRIGTLRRTAPRRWYQLLCNWKFGSTECGIDLSDPINSGDSAVDSATTTVLTDANLPCGASGDNWWKNGYIRFTSGADNYLGRRIKANDSTTLTFDTALPIAPASGDTYTLWRGCDQTWLVCSGDFDNDVNFGGFPTIPEQMEIR